VALKWASASVKGTSHIISGSRLQDACAVSCIGPSTVFAVVSDGAGSAEFGEYGAWIACRFLTVRFREWVRAHSDFPSDEKLTDWIDDLRDRIFVIANSRNSTPRQFAATLAAILVTPEQILTLHIGDSSIVGRSGACWEPICWPENGEYASTTYFITDSPEPRLNIKRELSKYDAFAIFSDGVGEIALSQQNKAAHPRFFEPMMRPVDNTEGEGRLVLLSKQLATYLESQLVCDRTDDDKTLILISGKCK